MMDRYCTLHFALLTSFMGLMLLNSCEAESSHKDLNLAAEHQMGNKKVKSILLYHEIGGFSNDSISAVLDDINSVIHTIDPQSNGYSLWQVQSDTIENYKQFIEGDWASQESYDLIHADSSFRAVLDKHLPVLNYTRSWDLYRRFEKF